MYRVDYSKTAAKALIKLDKQVATMLLAWIEKNLDGCENPRTQGKALAGKLTGYWRYAVGGYRLIANIQDAEALITIVNVGHRREIYQQS